MKLPDDYERKVIVSTFCLILIMAFGGLVVGLYVEKVDNKLIFPILDNDLKLILVAAAGFLGGRASMKQGSE